MLYLEKRPWCRLWTTSGAKQETEHKKRVRVQLHNFDKLRDEEAAGGVRGCTRGKWSLSYVLC